MNQQQSNNGRIHTDAKRIALLGLLFALAIVLSIVEGLLPIPAPVPGIKLGLSNIVVMFALFQLNKRDALALCILKAVFVAVTRGTVAGILSLTGGLFALGIMTLLIIILKDKSTYLLVSIAGAVFHNIGQTLAASIILQTFLWPYLSILIFTGLVTGFATSILLKLTSPVFLRLHLK
jgi:heptaprenyl diphosphate synthase